MKKNKNQIIDIIFMLFLSFAYVIPLFMSKGIYHSVNQGYLLSFISNHRTR